jgi:hypothetical protein
MIMLKQKHIYFSIVISGIINAIIGGILIYYSFIGHSSFGLISGALIPLAALSFYGEGYSKYKNFEITIDLLKKVFKPTIKIIYTFLVLNIILMSWVGFLNSEIPMNSENLLFLIVILLIFVLPNLVLQIGFYNYLKKRLSKTNS